MDFEAVIEMIARFFESKGFRFAVIGAFGLQAYGLARATQDFDIATIAGSQQKLVAFHKRWPTFNSCWRCRGLTKRRFDNTSKEAASWTGTMKSKSTFEVLDFEQVLSTTDEDVRQLRKIRHVPSRSVDSYLRFLRNFEPASHSVLRARKGPQGEPFQLPSKG